MKLLEQGTLGKQTLKNHMVMAAMTRSRADVKGIVGDLTENATHKYSLIRNGQCCCTTGV